MHDSLPEDPQQAQHQHRHVGCAQLCPPSALGLAALLTSKVYGTAPVSALLWCHMQSSCSSCRFQPSPPAPTPSYFVCAQRLCAQSLRTAAAAAAFHPPPPQHLPCHSATPWRQTSHCSPLFRAQQLAPKRFDLVAEQSTTHNQRGTALSSIRPPLAPPSVHSVPSSLHPSLGCIASLPTQHSPLPSTGAVLTSIQPLPPTLCPTACAPGP